MTGDDPIPTVIDLVRSRARRDGAGVDGDTTLADLGIDSLAVVALIVDLERELGVRFPAHMISHDVFRTVGTLTDAVAHLRGRDAVADAPARERSNG